VPSLGELLHPLTLLAAACLFLNDLVLKRLHLGPSWLTGKLSDVAGIALFPLLLTGTWRTLRWAVGRPGTDTRLTATALGLALAATAAGFATLKLSPAVARAAGAVQDPTDLVALVMLIPAAWVGRREIVRGKTPP